MTDIWLPPHIAHLKEPLTVRCSRCPWVWRGHRQEEGAMALAQHSETHAAFPSPLEFARGKLQQQILDEAYAPEDAFGKKAMPIVKGLTDTEENRRANIIEHREEQVVREHED